MSFTYNIFYSVLFVASILFIAAGSFSLYCIIIGRAKQHFFGFMMAVITILQGALIFYATYEIGYAFMVKTLLHH